MKLLQNKPEISSSPSDKHLFRPPTAVAGEAIGCWVRDPNELSAAVVSSRDGEIVRPRPLPPLTEAPCLVTASAASAGYSLRNRLGGRCESVGVCRRSASILSIVNMT